MWYHSGNARAATRLAGKACGGRSGVGWGGHYRSKRSFKEGTFSKLGKVLPDGAQLRVTNVIIAGDMAVVELVSDASARNGMRFDNHYCWVTRFHRIFFGGAYLEVDGERFDANGIRQLYESDTYPLGRRA